MIEQKQFPELVSQYEKLVYTICFQFTKNHHTAQDLTQETFLSVYSHLSSCPAENPKAWIARVAANKAKDYLKSAYNRRVSPSGEDEMPQNGVLFLQADRPEDITISQETVAQIEANIRSLKEPYHQVACLFFLEELTVEEISIRLERPPKTVHTQLYRAKKILQEQCKGGEHDGLIS